MNVPTRTKDTKQYPEIVDLIPHPVMLPDEDPTTFEALRSALFGELTPATAYESALAENLVVLEWEAIRHRRLRDNLIRSSYRHTAALALLGDDIHANFANPYLDKDSVEDSVRDLVSEDSSKRTIAEEELKDSGYDRSEIVSVAFLHVLKGIEAHEHKLADIEMRRRRLREDLDRLQRLRKRRFEDAEVIEA